MRRDVSIKSIGHQYYFLNRLFKNHLTMHSFIVNVPVEVEDEMWDDWVAKYDGREYDFLVHCTWAL